MQLAQIETPVNQVKTTLPTQRAIHAAAVVSVLVISGCSSMAPVYTVPNLPVPPTYASDTLQIGTRAAAVGWKDYFTDPRLQALIAQALDNNRDLRVAVLRVEVARAAYGIQRADQFPEVNVQTGVDRSRMPGSLSPTGVPLTGSQYRVALGAASWEIDFWGRVRSLKDAALENFLASAASRRASALGLVSQVVNSDLTLREFNERIAIANETVASRQESFRIFSRRVAVGSTSRFDLTQVQTLLMQAQAVAAQLEEARASELQALTLLVGAQVDLPPLQQKLEERFVLAELLPGVPSDLLTQRPDIVAAEHQLKSANADIGAARAAFFPRIALTSSLGAASNELDGLFKAGSRSWSFSPTFSLPLFDGGRLRNNLSLAQTRHDIAIAIYEKTVQSAFRDVADALATRHWLIAQLSIAESASAIQAERTRLSRLRYNNGGAAFLEVLDSQRDLLSAELQLVQTRRALLANRISLYAALGGGAMDYAAGTTP
jgi:outer membrane protein, multidrug efflux system